MYGGFVTLLMLAGIVVIIALVPSMSKQLLLKNMGKSELRKKNRYIDIYFLIVFLYFFIPICCIEWKNNGGIVCGAGIFCLDVVAFWLCKHHYFCYMLLSEQSRRWKEQSRKWFQKLSKPKITDDDYWNWYWDWYFNNRLYYEKYYNQEELDFHSEAVPCMMMSACMCVLLTLVVCGALIGFGTIFTGVSKFWCSAPEVLWYNLHHIEELPLNIWFYIAVAGCAVLLILALTSICNYVKNVVKKS